ncbi:MAG: intradiol ring-cleavage dioxygenase, partial [Anaerolineales bacterium]|nr:intradiol ring-cleavage dioxygenase [Anaerolineales bacterium]
FFDDAFTDEVYAQEPYLPKGLRNTLNAHDGIYGHSGSQLLLNVMPNASGYVASFDIGMQI